MPDQMTLEQFGAKIKAKYPEYASLPDVDIANKVIAKYPQYKTSIKDDTLSEAGTAKAPDWRDKYTTFTHQSDTPVHAVEDVFGNIGASALNTVLRPGETAKGIFRMSGPGVIEDLVMGRKIAPLELGESIIKHPADTAESMIGSAAVFDAAGEAVGPVTKGLRDATSKARRSVVETATGSGPKLTGELVKKVQAGNEAADAYSSLRAKIETARENALKIGNEKYAAVNPSLNPIEADPEVMEGALADATEALKGSHTEPTLLKQIVAKQQRGEQFTYEDLQGDYSRLGKELSKGTLPGDEFHAYDVLHEAIGDEMQRIADSEGKGAELKDARDYWRRMKQTFGKPLTQTDAATGVLRSASPDLAEQDTIANRVRLLGSFDPEIPKDFARLDKAQEASKGAPKPAPGETGKINEGDIRAAKAESIKSEAASIRKLGHRLGLIWPVLDAIRDVVRGEMPSVGGTVGGGLAIAGGSHAIASLLERPAVLEFLTRPTEADIAQIPPDMRGDLKPFVEAAQKKGIRVDAGLAALVGATAGVTGPKSQKIQQTRDEWYATHPR